MIFKEEYEGFLFCFHLIIDQLILFFFGIMPPTVPVVKAWLVLIENKGKAFSLR